MQDTNCIFCKIVLGQIPAIKVFESDTALAFLDVGPLAEGHVLIVPKEHYSDIRKITPEELALVMTPIPKLAAAIMRATGAQGLNFLQNTGAVAGQSVFHLHFHLIPRNDSDGLGYRWNAGKYAEGRAEELRTKIMAELA
ncbi:MAG: HIT family protein [Planctomycetes bacterium]|nr:HIT family protein [Planctomycetota bacterium]